MGNKIRNAIARFMYGRYGNDSLSQALTVAAFILLFLSTVFNLLGYSRPVFAVLSIVCYVLTFGLMVWSICRTLSRNIPARRRELSAWRRFTSKLRRKPKVRLPADTADHIFRACPKCRSVLRLPRQPGKHQAKCPRCGERFEVKVK